MLHFSYYILFDIYRYIYIIYNIYIHINNYIYIIHSACRATTFFVRILTTLPEGNKAATAPHGSAGQTIIGHSCSMYESWPKRTIKKYVQEQSTFTMLKNLLSAEYDYNAQEPPRQIMVVAKRNLSNLGSATEVCHCMYSMSLWISWSQSPLHSTKGSRCPSTKEEYKLVPANWWGRIYTNCKNGKSTTASACVSAQHHFQITAGNLPFAVC